MTAPVSLPEQGVEVDLDRVDGVHRPWCVQHSGAECMSEELVVPGSTLSVWLAAAGSERPRLVIDQPGDSIEIVVHA